MNATMKTAAVLCCVLGGQAHCEADNVLTGQLLDHCAAKQGAPDDFCIGYMEASINFISTYQSWLSLNHYHFPEPVICFPRGVTTIQAVDALRKYVARASNPDDQKVLARPAMNTLPRALAGGFPCARRIR